MSEVVLKLFRVKEEYKVTRWVYIRAEDEEAAMVALGNRKIVYQEDMVAEHTRTHWSTIQEVT